MAIRTLQYLEAIEEVKKLRQEFNFFFFLVILTCQYLQDAFVSSWNCDEQFLDVSLKMFKGVEYIAMFKELGYCWIPSVFFLAWWKKTERGEKKRSHRDVIKMQQQVLPHKTGFLRSPLTLPASFQVFFPPAQEVLHAPPAFLLSQYLVFPFL